MKAVIKSIVLALVSCLLSAQLLAQLNSEAIYQKAINSVFTIKTDKSQGTGFMFREWLVTNFHVIEGATVAVAIPSGNSNVQYDIAEGEREHELRDQRLDHVRRRGSHLGIPFHKQHQERCGDGAHDLGDPVRHDV